jgi:hypothetical protein
VPPADNPVRTATTPSHYDDVNAATGMLAAEMWISVADAFLRRRTAFSACPPLLDVARAVLPLQLQADSFQD